MNFLALENDGTSTLPIEELLHSWPDRYKLLCAVVSRGGVTSLAAKIAERDPDAGRRFIRRLDQVVAMEQHEVKREKSERFRVPVLAGIARAEAHRLLDDLE